MFGKRSFRQIARATVGRQHYVALVNMVRTYPEFWENFVRYLTGTGVYPYDIKIKTPTGILTPTLYSHHDLLTANEIFCRLDYLAKEDLGVVVDFGSNIGISALYFLSRNNKSKCYLYEPDQRNVGKLKKNLLKYQERYLLHENAVSYEQGQLEFGIEPTGRYGGIGVKADEKIVVECLHVNDVIKEVLMKEKIIDILKIDTEGVEEKTVMAIENKYLKRIKKIYIEANPIAELIPDQFEQKQYGSVCQLINRFI